MNTIVRITEVYEVGDSYKIKRKRYVFVNWNFIESMRWDEDRKLTRIETTENEFFASERPEDLLRQQLTFQKDQPIRINLDADIELPKNDKPTKSPLTERSHFAM